MADPAIDIINRRSPRARAPRGERRKLNIARCYSRSTGFSCFRVTVISSFEVPHVKESPRYQRMARCLPRALIRIMLLRDGISLRYVGSSLPSAIHRRYRAPSARRARQLERISWIGQYAGRDSRATRRGEGRRRESGPRMEILAAREPARIGANKPWTSAPIHTRSRADAHRAAFQSFLSAANLRDKSERGRCQDAGPICRWHLHPGHAHLGSLL